MSSPIRTNSFSVRTPIATVLTYRNSNANGPQLSDPYFRTLADLFRLSCSSEGEMMESIKNRVHLIAQDVSRGMQGRINWYVRPPFNFAISTGNELSPVEIEKIIRDADLLAVANEIADELGFSRFRTAEDARLSLNNPKNQAALARIQNLDLSSMELAFLPREIGYLENLTVLNLRDNRLRALPKEIGKLSHLVELDLSHNQIRMLPAEIKHLIGLKVLDLSMNQLRHLPSIIGSLAELVELDLRGNLLEEIPPEIGDLAYLQRLSLNHNQIRTLPIELGKLSRLGDLLANDDALAQPLDDIAELAALLLLNLKEIDFKGAPNKLQSLASTCKTKLDEEIPNALAIKRSRYV